MRISTSVKAQPPSTLHHLAVRACEGGNADLFRGAEHRHRGGSGIGRGLHEDGASGAAMARIGRALPILDLPEDLRDRVIAPGLIAGLLGEEVPVAAVAARPHHHVDAGAAAQHLAHRHRNGAAVQIGVWLRDETPVGRAAEVGRPRRRVHDARHLVAAAGFDQQDLDGRIFGKAPCDDRAGAAGAADDEVVAAAGTFAEPALIGGNAVRKLRKIRGQKIIHEGTPRQVGGAGNATSRTDAGGERKQAAAGGRPGPRNGVTDRAVFAVEVSWISWPSHMSCWARTTPWLGRDGLG